MRISSSYQFESLTGDVRNAQQRYFDLSRQVSSGKRINAISDDPGGAARAISMHTLKSSVEQYKGNLTTAKGVLTFTESALSDMKDVMSQGYELAVSGANSSTDQNARSAMAAQVGQLQQKLLDLANTKGPSGNYLFAGQKTTTKPYTITGSAIAYNGDGNNLNVEVGPADMMVVNTQGEPTISTAYNQLETLKNNLLGGNVGGLSGVSVADMQASMTTLTNARGAVGTKLQTINDLDAQWTRRSDDLETSISDIEEVDLTEAIVKYQQANQAYTAALTVASQGFRTSLMDFIHS